MDIKHNALIQQRGRITSHFQAVLKSAKLAKTELECLEILWKGASNSPVPDVRIGLNLENIEKMIDQAKDDLCLGPEILKSISDKLEKRMIQTLGKFDTVFLFSSLLKEWLESDGAVVNNDEFNEVETDSFTETGRPEKYETINQLESIIFEKSSASVSDYQKFLYKLFELNDADIAQISEPFVYRDTDINRVISIGTYISRSPWITHSKNAPSSVEELNSLLKNTLLTLRKNLGIFSKELMNYEIRTVDVMNCCNSLMSGELLSDEKREMCKEIKNSTIVLQEVTSVLNIMLRDLDGWNWPAVGVTMQWKRALNGKYRCFPDEEIVSAIFLEFIGLQWSVKIHSELDRILQSAVWKRPEASLTPAQTAKRNHMVSDVNNGRNGQKCLSTSRGSAFMEKFFMSLLPTSMENGMGAYDDVNDEEDPSKPPTAAMLKQHLLHRILTSANMSQVANPTSELTVVSADLEWFGPSLSHEILLETMKFAGASEIWLRLFKKFLEVPSKFAASDPVRIRVRGTPISHATSTMLAELMLFFMEFAVNKETDGIQFYRLHDDFWFFDTDEKKCISAWNLMKNFNDLVGIKFNEEKCGSVKIFGVKHPAKTDDFVPASKPLPQAPFGRGRTYQRDEAAIEQTAKRFRQNYGARIFGQSHIENIIATMKKVNMELFPKTKGDVVQYISDMIKERFPDVKVFESWILWPMSHGGLGLTNHSIDIHAMLQAYKMESRQRSKQVITADSSNSKWEEKVKYPDMEHCVNPDEYEEVEVAFKKTVKRPRFMKFEEFCLARTHFSSFGAWVSAESEMLATPVPVKPLEHAGIDFSILEEPFCSSWSSIPTYWQYVLAYYGQQLYDDLGTLAFVPKDLIPLGMVESFKTSKVKWEQ
ncbi:hypothetical protein HK098_002756 [Nowakowskiella sp. JEL0407]|nr:hypothetical protein HK098_002756 [Nowakowskiella sp. JEL0407]